LAVKHFFYESRTAQRHAVGKIAHPASQQFMQRQPAGLLFNYVDGKPPRGLGIFLGDRLVVFYSHESDLGNGWEDVGTYPEDPAALHEAALRMGVNLFTYAVTSAGAR
jgi:hypothetical protein